jgi:rod shape determining protein RodA
VRAIKNFDWLLLTAALVLTSLGIAFIWSSTHWAPARSGDPAAQQFRWFGVSLLALLACLSFDYSRLASLAYPIYLIAAVGLALVLTPKIGVEHQNARRWLEYGGLSVQPSELMKVAVVLALARCLMYRRLDRGAGGLIAPLLIGLVPMGLILVEPDLGTALVLLPTLFAMLYAAGARPRHLLALAAAGLAAAPLMWFFVMGKAQRSRVTAFLWPQADPRGAGLHLRQSLAAVSSGGVSGTGFSNGSPVVLNRGFAAHTDFIFAVIANEWGFLGAMAVLLLLFLVLSRGMEIAGATREPFGRLLVVGVLTTLGFQASVNIAMTVRLCPITGITLPFVSYGGSSLLICFVMAALVLNVGMHRKAVLAP